MKEKLKYVARFAMRLMVKLRLLWIFPSNPRILRIHGGEFPLGFRRLCVFASYSRSGGVEDYVVYNLAELRKAGFDNIFVTTSQVLHSDDLEKLQSLCLRVVHRQNTGYDFASWKAGIFSAGIDYMQYDQLLLTNDSYYGPLIPWEMVISAAKTDLYGITDSYGIAYHLMSYFVLYNNKILHSEEFRQNWRKVRMVPTLLKTLIIYEYEVGLSQKFQKAGYTASAFCPERELFTHLPNEQHLFGKTITVHRYWRELLEKMRCPILKVDTFWRIIRGDTAWRKVVNRMGYDIKLIENHQQNLRRKAN